MGVKSILLLTAAVIIPQSAWSQDVIELDEAFVFSGLLPVEVSRTGATVEVLEGAELDGQGQSVQETLTRLPGVSVVANGGLGQESTLVIRGLGETYIGVTYDGIEMTDPAAPTNAFAFGQLSRAQAGRVELTKGTQTAVYGSDAIAGTVNIVSWRPDKDGVSYRSNIEAGSFGTLAGSLSMGQRSETAEVAFTVSRITTDGYAADVTNTEADGFRQTVLSFALEGSLSDTVDAGVTLFHSDDETEYDAFGSTAGLSDGERTGIRAFMQARTGAVEHEVAMSFFTGRRDEVSAFGPFPFEGQREKLEYTGRTRLGAAAELAFGADWTEEVSSAGGTAFMDENTGIYGEITYALSSQTDLAVSMRQDLYSDFDDQITGRIAAVHRYGNGVTVKGTLGTGYRAPSLQERFGFGGDLTFVPEESLGGDFGVTKDYGSGSVGITAFYTEIDNLIRYDRATFSLFQLPGTTTSRGVEVSSDWRFGSATVYGNYTYTGAETDGARLVRVPRHDLTLGVEGPLAGAWSGSVDIRAVRDLLDVNGAGDSVALDDFKVVNVGLSYDISASTEAYLRLDNVMDEDYQTTLGYNAPGRSVFVGLSASF